MTENAGTIRRETSLSFDEARERVIAELAERGFGVLTEIDVQATLAKKLGASFRRYTILGACNPGFAHRALSADLSVGTLLPCNVVVYEADDGASVLEAVNPLSMIPTDQPELKAVATDARERIAAALDAV